MIFLEKGKVINKKVIPLLRRDNGSAPNAKQILAIISLLSCLCSLII